MSSLWPMQMFDANADFSVVERKLPHWAQAGTVCFITFRTIDSMPANVLRHWHAERATWLRQHGIDPTLTDWRERLSNLARSVHGEFTRIFSDRWHRSLDECHGACVLRQPELAKIVADSLMHFDGERYLMSDFVVMPNHVHLLAAFVDEDGMLAQCESWKHYMARQINLRIGESGRFWQQDGFDHLVRSTQQFEAIRRYIAANPDRASLKPGEFVHFFR